MSGQIQLIEQWEQSESNFPVDFEVFWQWLGYFDKATAKRAFLKCGFVAQVDYLIISTSAEPDNHAGYSPQELAALATRKDIYLTTDCAKSFAMMAGTEQGKQVRLYFLEVEKRFKALVAEKPEIPTSYADALRLLASEVEEKERLQAQTMVLVPKAELADNFIASDGLVEIQEFAKDLGYKQLGRNNLYKHLRNKGVLTVDNEPYQRYVTSGYFLLKPTGFYNHPLKGRVTSFKVFLTPKGVDWLIKELKKDGYEV
jgi:anti-repressor protein